MRDRDPVQMPISRALLTLIVQKFNRSDTLRRRRFSLVGEVLPKITPLLSNVFYRTARIRRLER
eukprot:819088-Amphidinium_carterae.1